MRNWLLAIRFKTLSAAISPVILGSSLAFHDGIFYPFVFFMTLLASILIQIGTNFANDVYDYEKGSDREDRLGPLRATQMGLILPITMKKAMWLTFFFSICIGFYLVMIGGWPIICIGLLSIASGIAYTGGPYPLGYYGFGDVFVFIFFGIIAVSGTYYLQTGVVNFEVILLGVSIGMLSTAVLVVNNLRDINADKISGKRTLAVLFGEKFTKFEYSILMLLPFFFPIYMWLKFQNEFSLFITIFALPISLYLVKDIYNRSGRELNNILARTSRFLFVFSCLLSIGLIL